MADPKSVVEHANALFGEGRFEAALAAYDEALLLVTSAPELHCNRGAALRYGPEGVTADMGLCVPLPPPAPVL